MDFWFKDLNIETMATFAILLILVLAGIYLATKTYDYDFLGIVIAVFAGVFLIIHTVAWSLASYDYNVFVVKRQAFVDTLKEARTNGSEIELAAIIKDISEWNQKLAEYKYVDSIFLLDDYVDDRINDLEPIK
jgi:hypothetical protein